MNRHDKWSGAIGMVIGLAFCIASASLGLGEVHQPGPGFLPFVVGGALIFLSAIIFLPALRKGKRINGERMTGGMGKYRKGGLILLDLIFYNLALGFLGFTVTTFLFVVFLMKIVETQRWARTLVTALCSAVGFYFVFQSWLMVDLPTGPWRF
jgi:putative tricarboxylic transport membrane protein